MRFASTLECKLRINIEGMGFRHMGRIHYQRMNDDLS